MDLKSLKALDSSTPEDFPKIRRRMTEAWSNDIGAPIHHHERSEGILRRLYQSIESFCEDTLRKLDDLKAHEVQPMTRTLYRLLDSVHGNFVDWGDEFNVGDGDLDDALKDSQDLRQYTITTLMSICETLINDLLPSMLLVFGSQGAEDLQLKAKKIRSIADRAGLHAQGNHDAEDSTLASSTSEAESPGTFSDRSSLEDVLENLKSDVDALIELRSVLENPIKDTIDTQQAAVPQPSAGDPQHQAFFDGIKQKHPGCDNTLAIALSKAIYDTAIRLHGERQAAISQQSKPVPEDSGYGTMHKSSHAGSVPDGSSYARTLASFAETEDGTSKTPFPPQPAHLKVGDKFSCNACGKPVAKAETGTAWRRHLLSDLRPWVCCQVSCKCLRHPYKTKSYKTKGDWIRHLQAQHEVHPEWDDKKCPFCQRVIEMGGDKMMRHVERHLHQLSLAALPASPGDDDDEIGSEDDSDGAPVSADGSNLSSPSLDGNEQSFQDHPLYKHADQGNDGLWHCPWEGEGYCDHQPSVLKADFDQFVKMHLGSLQCKVEGCLIKNTAFATREILYLHEQDEHDMHQGGGLLLCTSPGCGRSRPGNGFANKWIWEQHITGVHGLPPPPEDDADPLPLRDDLDEPLGFRSGIGRGLRRAPGTWKRSLLLELEDDADPPPPEDDSDPQPHEDNFGTGTWKVPGEGASKSTD